MPKTIEIVTLVYRSIAYVDFAVAQLRRFARVDPAVHPNYSVSFRLIANDATEPVLRRLSQIAAADPTFRYSTFSNSNPSEYYINRVYRAWNYAMRSSTADIVCPLNSDMALSEGWLDALLVHHDGVNIPCSRLVERGADRCGYIGQNHPMFQESRHVAYGEFGDHAKRFKQDEWIEFSRKLAEEKRGLTEPYGFYCPYLIDRERFIEAGAYPEGNIHCNGVGVYEGIRSIRESGDSWFFREMLYEKFRMKHITVFDSLVYHFREAEMVDMEVD